jgi:hypothetical protein
MQTLTEPQFRPMPLTLPMPQFEHPVSRFFGKGKIANIEQDGEVYRYAIFHARIIGAN